nr:N-acetylglucosamine-6-phosphate deacetylase [Litchfieldia salsa]
MRLALVIKDITIYAEDETLQSGFIKIQEGKIQEIGSMKDYSLVNVDHEISLSEDYKMVPGFIDLHIHGVNGSDTMDGTNSSLLNMAATLPKEGTTSFIATTMTQEISLLEKVLKNTGEFIHSHQQKGHAEILGIHLEGPFIHSKMAGAQPIHHIIPPDVNLLTSWLDLSKNTIRLVTSAPELPGGLELVKLLARRGIVSSIGHSIANYNEVLESIQAGATHITHLFNQMRGLHHREPGVVGSAFLQKDLMVELIVDGIHVSPEMVKLSYQQITADRLILITDSIRAKGLSNGEYDLGGQKVFVNNGRALLNEHTLAGSVLSMSDAFKNIIEYTGCSIEEAVQMSSTNPAKQVGVLDRKGTIKEGKDADLVLLNQSNDVMMTFCKGHLVYEAKQ